MPNVLVAYDGSEQARRALERAAAIDRKGGRLAVISVAPVQFAGRGGGIDPTSNVEDHRAMLEEAKAVLGADAHTIEAVGHPADAIVAAAEQDGVDLIVMGHRGLGAVQRFLVGSTSSRVVAHAPCDVLVVR